MKQFRIIISVFLLFASVTFAPAARPANAFIGWVGAAGSAYDGSASMQPMDILASDACDYSYSPSLVLDSSGYPCIAWSENVSGYNEVFFARWNGTAWVNASGAVLTSTNGNVSNNTDDSEFPKLTLDSNDNPYIAWRDATPGNYEIFFARWNGTAWVNASGAVLTSSNGNMSNNSGDSVNPSLALDSSDNPCIAWQDDTSGNFEIFYARWNGTSWINVSGTTLTTTNGNMSNSSGASLNPCLVFDSNNRPHIAWGDSTSGNQNIFYASWDGSSWVDVSGTTISGTIGTVFDDSGISAKPCLVLDNSGYPCISWTDNTSGNFEIFFTRWNGTSWVDAANVDLTAANANISNDTNHSYDPSMKLDSSGNPYIAWFDATSPSNYEIFYARWYGTSWEIVNVSQNSDISTEPSLVLDSNGNPHLAWSNDYIDWTKIFYVKFQVSFDGSFAMTKSVDTDGDGDFADSGTTVDAGSTLDYRINWQFNPGQDPLEDPYLYDTIPDGTTYVTGSASPSSNIEYSIDGGLTWTAGEPPDGSPAGTILRWNMNVSTNSWVGAAGSAYVGSVIPQPTDINVSSDSSTSTRSSIAIDSYGNPNIAWMDTSTGNSEIIFTKWDGSSWVNVSGLPLTIANGNVSNNSGGSSNPTLVLDSTNRPCIAWTDNTPGNTEIYFSRWNGTSWVTANGSTLTPTNANVTNDADFSQSPSLALDAQNNPHIAWCNWMSTDFEILYTKWNGSIWVNAAGSSMTTANANLTNDSENNYMPSLELDSSGYPWIAWYITPVSNYEIMLGRWNGTAWVNVSGAPLTVANANVSNNSGISQEPSLDLDSNDRPCISWYDNTPGNFDIYFARWNGANWVTANGSLLGPTNANCSNNAGESNYPRLVLDSNDNPNIVWYDDTLNPGTNSIFYIKWNGVLWVNASGVAATTANSNVSNNTYRAYFADLALNSNDSPYITWTQYSPTVPDIYFVRFGIDSAQLTFSVEVDSPPTTLAFCNTATFRHRWDSGKALESNEVCNTIDYDFTGTFTLEKGVDANSDGKYIDNGATVNPGTNLGYKIDWTFTNPNNDPLFAAYVNDQIPPGTKYIAGSATLDDLSHSLDDGTTWIAGEPPDGALPGTRLRWGSLTTGWVGAANSRYNGMNVLQPYDINVTKGQMGSSYPMVAVDSHNRPHMVWLGNNTSTWEPDVFYGKWDGTQWVNAAGLPLTYANSNITNDSLWDSFAILVIDQNDMPNIAWSTDNGGNRKIAFTKWDGTQWVNADGTPYSYAGSSVTDPGDSAFYPSMDIDSSNRPCISWVSSGASDLIKFARWNGSNWVTVQGANITASNGLLTPSCTNYQYAPNLKMSSQDNPCIAWQEFDINTYITQIMYASWNGSAWVNTSGQAYSFDNWNVSRLPESSYVPSLQIDGMDRPSIAWEYSYNWDYDIYCVRWDGAKWTDASGATYNPGTNGNVSYPSNMSITPDLELDPSGNLCLSWIDNGAGTDQAYFVRWNGTNWTTADGRVADATNPNVSNAPSHIYDPNLAIDSNGNPHMVWSGMVNLNPEGPRDIIYVTFEPGKKTMYFGVKVDNPFTNMNLSPVCNIATFSHVFDKGVQVVSNSACVVLKSEKVENSNLVVRKVAKSMQYNPTDTFEFKITVTNTGNLEALNVVLVDNFPKEFVFASSLPSGLVGLSGVKFTIGKLAPKASETFSLKFKLSPKITVNDCILATNEAIATSTTQVVKDTAVIRICSPTTPDPLSLEIIWQGIDVKTSIGKANVPVILNIKPHGGTSPYDVTIDWGDGTTSKVTSKNKENKVPEVSRQYEKPGEYTVTIKCVDSYGSTRIVTRKIKIIE